MDITTIHDNTASPSILQFNESKIELNNNFISRHQKISLSLNVDDVANYQEF